jgi:hypothetical protein
VIVYHSFFNSSYLENLELAATIAYNISFHPVPFKQILIDWFMSLEDAATSLSSCQKACLWRLLIFSDKGDPGSFITDPEAREEDEELESEPPLPPGVIQKLEEVVNPCHPPSDEHLTGAGS